MRNLKRSTGLFLALLFALTMLLAACGSNTSSATPTLVKGEFVEYLNLGDFGLSTDGQQVIAYLCDGNVAHLSVAEWFKGTVTKNSIDITNAHGSHLVAALTPQAVTGTMHVHSEGLGLEAPTVTSGLMNDHLTGYLVAIGVVAALAEREQQGGFWRVEGSLTRTSMLGNELLEALDDEPYAPVTMQDLIEQGVDQDSPWGTFTRFAPPVAFSHTPSFALRPPAWPGTDPDTIGWTANAAGDAPPQVPHYPSKLAREGRIRNLVSCFGIEDRGDGGGVVGLVSKPEALEAQMRKYRAG